VGLLWTSDCRNENLNSCERILSLLEFIQKQFHRPMNAFILMCFRMDVHFPLPAKYLCVSQYLTSSALEVIESTNFFMRFVSQFPN